MVVLGFLRKLVENAKKQFRFVVGKSQRDLDGLWTQGIFADAANEIVASRIPWGSLVGCRASFNLIFVGSTISAFEFK